MVNGGRRTEVTDQRTEDRGRTTNASANVKRNSAMNAAGTFVISVGVPLLPQRKTAIKAAITPAAICAIQYGITSLTGHLPRRKTASVTAGLRCPPEMCPVAKTMTMSEAPIASGAMTPAAPGMTVQPTVRTRKNVPINSAIYLFIAFGLGVGGAPLA